MQDVHTVVCIKKAKICDHTKIFAQHLRKMEVSLRYVL